MRKGLLMLCITAGLLCAFSPPPAMHYDVVVVEDLKQEATKLVKPCLIVEMTAGQVAELLEPEVLCAPVALAGAVAPVGVAVNGCYGKKEHGTTGHAIIRRKLVQNSFPDIGHIDPGLRTYGNA